MDKNFNKWKADVQKIIKENDLFKFYNWHFYSNKSITISGSKRNFLIQSGVYILLFTLIFFFNDSLNISYKSVYSHPFVYIIGPVIIFGLLYYYYVCRNIVLDISSGEIELQNITTETITYKKNSHKYDDYNINVKTTSGSVYTIMNLTGKKKAEDFVRLLKEYIIVKDKKKMKTGQFTN